MNKVDDKVHNNEDLVTSLLEHIRQPDHVLSHRASLVHQTVVAFVQALQLTLGGREITSEAINDKTRVAPKFFGIFLV